MTYFDQMLFNIVLNMAVELEYYGGFVRDLDIVRSDLNSITPCYTLIHNGTIHLVKD